MQKQYLVTQPQHLFSNPSAISTASNTFGFTDVLIFKTNIQTNGDQFRIKRTLDSHPLIQQWNIDLEDIDCVLRIESTHLNHNDIIDLLAKNGYYCEELTY
ncbi:MAG: hypothetical protein ABIN91_21595 [Mucilaginibacter sp.]|uniref:hypothetical protein n=1 Tax=Mucilaginibacter sp. TaxID=1882438 RepID=UPI0032675AC9